MNMQLRAAREASGKTQAQVAQKARVAERRYQEYEYGKREPGVSKAIRIAKALGATVEELFAAEEKDGGNRPIPARKGKKQN